MEDLSRETSSISAGLPSSDPPKLENLIENHRGRVYLQVHSDWKFCKPKLLPLKTFTIEKLEKLQQEAEAKLRSLPQEGDT